VLVDLVVDFQLVVVVVPVSLWVLVQQLSELVVAIVPSVADLV
jgi:hypothetical protein